MCLWWGPSRTAESSSRTGSAGAGLLFTNMAMSANKEALSGTVGEMVFPGLHIKARAKHPAYPERFPVIDELVPWSTPAPGYSPVDYVNSNVLANSCDVKVEGWADSAVPSRELIEQRRSYELEKNGLSMQYDAQGRPLNPAGRTGLCNRGTLGKWGPNHAADPIVTRRNIDKKGQPLEVVVIKRKDTGEWAIPGGMVDSGELVSQTLRREFAEEAGNVPTHERAKFDAMAAELFSEENGKEVYRGYVDDPRNTDNAWMETVAMRFHCPDELGRMLMLNAGDDACEVQWLEVGEHCEQYRCVSPSRACRPTCVRAIACHAAPWAAAQLLAHTPRLQATRNRPP